MRLQLIENGKKVGVIQKLSDSCWVIMTASNFTSKKTVPDPLALFVTQCYELGGHKLVWDSKHRLWIVGQNLIREIKNLDPQVSQFLTYMKRN